jgi:hypothetical protein
MSISLGILIVLSILVLKSCMNTDPTSSKDSNGAALPPSTPLLCPNDSGATRQGPFVSKQGTQLLYAGKPLKLYGSTFYPASVGGSAAWHTAKFTHYIDHTLAMEVQGGQNLIRPTDFWDRRYHDRLQDDVTIWKNMDYLVCTARQYGIFVVMDVSAFKWFLISQGENPYDARNWTTFLEAIGKHYANQPSIAFYSISGEPSPPHSVDEMNRLVDFYRAVTDELHVSDGKHHLITAGGFNHMEDETPRTNWWQQIYSLPNNNLLAFKTYSQDDLNLISSIAAFAKGLGKPYIDEEFGMPQYMGDGKNTGKVYNHIRTSRAQFFENVYNLGEENGVGGFVFWDLGCELRDTSYQVGPTTPAVWHVIQAHAPNQPAAPGQAAQLC